MTQTETQIFDEIFKTIELLGGQSDLLCIVGSFKTTQPDETVLADSTVERVTCYKR